MPTPPERAELDGRPVTAAELQTLALTNLGHFTSMRVERDGVRGLAHHLERLQRDCRAVFHAGLDGERVRALVGRALTGVPRPVVARVTVFDPDLDAAGIGADAHPRVLVTMRSAPALPRPPLRLRAVAHTRPLPEVKHVGIFPTLLHRREAQRAGFDDVVLVDGEGRLTEIATSNLAAVVGGRLVWPAGPCLAGVTVALLDAVEAAPTVPVRYNDLAGIDALVALNAVTGVRAIVAVDAVAWPDEHPLVARLRAAYEAVPRDAV
jgi:branched-subunit amino acid aminotransferase/4-amino-4-deoxychorismate lyase